MVADRAAAGVALANLLRPGDVVLVKSSRDAGLRWLGDELAAVGQESNESADHGTGGRD
jgi:UDP-N-acetylmuramoyl-tripeptide--D-alanyl-D-alanine ligase